MAIPNTDFYYAHYDDLVVGFKDVSLNTPTSWLWDFGDGNTSVEQNPEHTYLLSGTYVVKLTSTNVDGSTEKERSVLVPIAISIPIPIELQIEYRLPTNFTINSLFRDNLIKKWQLLLQDAFEIKNHAVFNQQAWPPLVNMLISSLVVYDFWIKLMNELVYNQAAGAGADGATGNNGSGIKKIITGPSEVEWHNTTEAVFAFFGKGRPGDSNFTALKQEICSLSSKLEVYIGICPQRKIPIHFKKAEAPPLIDPIELLNKYF